MPNWRSTLAGIGFRPHGSFGAIRARVEDVEVTVVENGMGRLSCTFTHVGRRSAMQYEVTVPLDVTAQQVAQLIVDAFERAHPEARGKTGSPHAAPEEYDLIRVGGALIERERAIDWAHEYLTGSAAWAYPAYDAYQVRSDQDSIEDADLLAPMLLDVNRLTLKAYYGLQEQRDRLQEWLAAIPRDAELISAEDDDLEPIRMLFGVLDDPGIPDVRGPILAKILHRKRPGFIPLYDEKHPPLLPGHRAGTGSSPARSSVGRVLRRPRDGHAQGSGRSVRHLGRDRGPRHRTTDQPAARPRHRRLARRRRSVDRRGTRRDSEMSLKETPHDASRSASPYRGPAP